MYFYQSKRILFYSILRIFESFYRTPPIVFCSWTWTCAIRCFCSGQLELLWPSWRNCRTLKVNKKLHCCQSQVSNVWFLNIKSAAWNFAPGNPLEFLSFLLYPWKYQSRQNKASPIRDVKPFYKLDIENFTLPSYESP